MVSRAANLDRDSPPAGVLPKDYKRPALDKHRLGELIDLIADIGLGDAENRSKDILGRVYEYFLSQFASAEGKKGGEFYTPRCVVRLLVEMIEPFTPIFAPKCLGSAAISSKVCALATRSFRQRFMLIVARILKQ